MTKINSAASGEQRSNEPDGLSRLAQVDQTKDLRADLKSGKVKVVGGAVGGPGNLAARALAIASVLFRGGNPGSAGRLEALAGRIVRYMEGRQSAYPNAFDGLKGKDYTAMAQALDEASKGLASPAGCSPMSTLHAQMNAFRRGEISMSQLLSNASKSAAKGDLPWVVNQLRGANRFKLTQPPADPVVPNTLGGLRPNTPTGAPVKPELPPTSQLGNPANPTRAPLHKVGELNYLFPKWMRGTPPKDPSNPR